MDVCFCFHSVTGVDRVSGSTFAITAFASNPAVGVKTDSLSLNGSV
jgi:hypothetical protein